MEADSTSTSTRAKADSTAILKARLDSQLDDLSKNVLPSAPYLLRMPYQRDNPQPKPPSQRHWSKGTPFQPEEESMQYLTFHQTPGGLLRAVGQWDDGHGGFAPPEPANSHSSNGRTPVQGHSAKKVISFAEYQNRDKGISTPKLPAVAKVQKPATVVHPSQPQLVKDQADNDSLPDSGKQEPNTVEDVTSKLADPSSDHAGVKRKRSISPDPKSRSSSTNGLIAPPAGKKSRLSEDAKVDTVAHCKQTAPANVQAQPPTTNGTQTQKDSQRLPSPAAPAKAFNRNPATPNSNKKPLHMPKLVSPTLPGALNSQLPPMISPTLPPEIEDMLAGVQSRRPGGPHKAASGSRSVKTASLPQAMKKSTKADVAAGLHNRTTSDSVSGSGSVQKKSKWVVLRIDCARLARVVRAKELMGSQGSQKKGTGSNSHHRPLSRSSALDKITYAGVRKTGKTVNGSHTPATPAAATSSPPGPGTPSGSEIRPSSSATSAAMRRDGSGQGSSTAIMEHSRNATPSSPLKADQRAAYEAESDRLSKLGRSLKHESDKFLKKEKPSLEQKHHGLVIATESCLTFALAATLLDEPWRRESQASRHGIWPSLLPFLSQITKQAEPFPHLQGLLWQIEAVVRDTIIFNVTQRLQNFARETVAPNEGQQKLLRELTEHSTRARKAWRNGLAHLWVRDLIQSFPLTWAKARPSSSRGKGFDGADLNDLAVGGFALPMSVSTSSIEAVNAGLSLLHEYCQREKIDWKAKLVL